MKNIVAILLIVLAAGFANSRSVCGDSSAQYEPVDSAYAIALHDSASVCYNSKDYVRAIAFEKMAAGVWKAAVGKINPTYVTLMDNLAYFLSLQSDYAEAIARQAEAIGIAAKLYGQDSGRYASLLNSLALYNNAAGNYAGAAEAGARVAEIYGKVLGADNPDYLESLLHLAEYKANLGDYHTALSVGEQALDICENSQKDNGVGYMTALNNLSNYNYYVGNYRKSIELGEKALDVCRRLFGENNMYFIASLSNMASRYGAIGSYRKAVDLATGVVEAYRQALGEGHPSYAAALSNLAFFHRKLGNFSEAVKLEQEALEIRGRVMGTEHPDYAMSLDGLAACYYALGNNAKAVELGTRALEIRRRVFGEGNYVYALSLSNLSVYDVAAGNYSEAAKLGEQALSVYEKTVGVGHPSYLAALNNLASSYYYMKDYSHAMTLAGRALTMCDSVFGECHYNSAAVLNNLSKYSAKIGNFEDAIKFEAKALDIVGAVYGDSHPEYVKYLQNMASYYYYNNDAGGMKRSASAVTDRTNHLVLSTFRDLTAFERLCFWNEHKSWYDAWLPAIVYKEHEDSAVMAAYDGVLLSKGILLNSDIEMRQLLLESGDTAAVELYAEMVKNRSVAHRQRENLSSSQSMDDSARLAIRHYADSLNKVADRQEHELVERSKVFGDYTKNLAVGWRDVQGMLGNSDIAIEFMEIPASADSTVYAAMTLKRGYDCPHFVRLFDKEQLDEMDRNFYFSSSALYNLVWKPLEKELAGVKNIYFAPAGELYRLAVEYAPVDGEEIFSDRYNVYRLSSTRQLAVKTEEKSVGMRAVLYGGMRYDTSPSLIVADSRKYVRNGAVRSFEYVPADSLVQRGTVAELPATKMEVDSIDRMMKSRRYDVDMFSDTIGTEASFKALSGQRRNIIHVATHGFYGENMAGGKTALLQFDNDVHYEEDKAMSRSGLLFAGAANAWQMPDSVDNGILTAQEVSALDLRGLDLCVLSACETGLGKITGEGVFGLQRGFKKAGAETLLMSLRPVYDGATGLLMTEFYRNFLAGKSKTESLKAAQRYLRDYEVTVDPEISGEYSIADRISKSRSQARKAASAGSKTVKPYADPVYWAYFILVDAL